MQYDSIKYKLGGALKVEFEREFIDIACNSFPFQTSGFYFFTNV
jgi:hypothetical protein